MRYLIQSQNKWISSSITLHALHLSSKVWPKYLPHLNAIKAVWVSLSKCKLHMLRWGCRYAPPNISMHSSLLNISPKYCLDEGQYQSVYHVLWFCKQTTKAQIGLRICAVRSRPLLLTYDILTLLFDVHLFECRLCYNWAYFLFCPQMWRQRRQL